MEGKKNDDEEGKENINNYATTLEQFFRDNNNFPFHIFSSGILHQIIKHKPVGNTIQKIKDNLCIC